MLQWNRAWSDKQVELCHRYGFPHIRTARYINTSLIHIFPLHDML
jgi:hypothetical protein